jgi:hypothetical protein
MAMTHHYRIDEETLDEEPVGLGSPLELRRHTTSAKR